jgi:hypothetical protein
MIAEYGAFDGIKISREKPFEETCPNNILSTTNPT